MDDVVALTVRLPSKLSDDLVAVSKKLRITRTNLLKISIHAFSIDDEAVLDYESNAATSSRKRVVLKLGRFLYDIVERESKSSGQSINAVIVAIGHYNLLRVARRTKQAGH